MTINLVWGESVAVREQFVAGIKGLLPFIAKNDLLDLNYSPFEGDPTLIQHTREVIKRQIGLDYKHIVLTNGAAGGCVIAMRAFEAAGFTEGMVPLPPYFSLYPSMVKASGLRLVHDQFYSDPNTTVYLVDSPSNPEGNFRQGRPMMPTIWDAVYGNRVYSKLNQIIPHDVLVGSYSKLTGLNGIRIGWIASNDDLFMERVKVLVAAEYCGLSVPSINVLNQILPNYDWDTFEKRANRSLDCNREEWAKLEKYFGGKPVSENGMFYYGPMDISCKKLFERAGVVWSPGSKLGHNDDFGRFNIGQSLDLVKNAVANVLKADKLP